MEPCRRQPLRWSRTAALPWARLRRTQDRPRGGRTVEGSREAPAVRCHRRRRGIWPQSDSAQAAVDLWEPRQTTPATTARPGRRRWQCRTMRRRLGSITDDRW